MGRPFYGTNMPPFDGQIPPGLAAMAGGAQPPMPMAPGAGGAPGGLPPSLQAGPPGAGPASMPQGNPGNALAALADVKTALTLLQKALPAIPMGTPVHSDILKTVSMLAKHIPEQGAGGGAQVAGLQALISQIAQQQPNAALARMAQQHSPMAPPAMAPQPSPGAPPGMAA